MNIKLTNLYKVKNIIFLAFLVAVFNGCSDEENKEKLTPITFTTNKPTVEAVPYVTSNSTKSGIIGNVSVVKNDLQALSEQKLQSTWEVGDKIGIYGIKANTELTTENIWDNINNMEFGYTNEDQFIPQQTIYYPEDNSSLDFIAYYPYSENITNFSYPIDIKNNNDVLYSNNLKGLNAENNSGNTLEFKRILTKLILNFTAKPSNASLSGLKVTFKNIKTKATLSLKTGMLTTDDSSTDDVQLSVTNNVLEAYLLPTTASQNTTIVFEVSGKTYNWQITHAMQKGKAYSYNITLDKLPVAGGLQTKYMELPLYNPAGKTTNSIDAPNSIIITHMIGNVNWLNDNYEAPKSMRNYSIAYDTVNLIPYWVAYPMHPVYRKGGNRTNKWDFDPKLSEKRQAKLKYGYNSPEGVPEVSRGHMLASSDRNASRSINKTTFYYTNMAPQPQSMNSPKWSRLEQKIQSWCNNTVKYDTLYVVTGTILPKNKANYVYTKENNGKNVAIPAYCYKALLHKNKVTGKYQSIAFKMENIEDPKDYEQCVISVAELEQETGFTFFPNLPDDVEQQVKQNKNLNEWAE